MDELLHVVCPHCDTINRLPRARLAAGGRCGNCHKALFEGHPVALDTARFERHLDKGDLPMLIDFWTPWCGPCRTMAPEFERAAASLEPAVRLVKVNVDEEPRLAERFQVRSIPTLLLFKGGQVVESLVGLAQKDHLKQVIDKHVQPVQPA